MSLTNYSNGYKYRRLITIDNTKVDGSDHTNFPILFKRTLPFLRSKISGGKVEYINGIPDIRFETTGGTKLDHEIESYDASIGQLIAWVEIGTLLEASNTTIYIYYGNESGVASEENGTGVWDGNYQSVYHLSDDPSSSTNIIDSTSNGNDGTKGNGAGNPTESTGPIHKAQDFVASELDRILLPYVNLGGSITYEMWYNLDDSASSQNGLCFMDTLVRIATTEIAYWSDVDSAAKTANPSIGTGAWHFLTITQTGTTYTIYNDGVSIGTGTIAAVDTTDNNNYLGFYPSGSYLNGLLAEVRLSDTNRSAGWISTSYNTQADNDSFFSLGAEESQQAGFLNQYVGATNYILGSSAFDSGAIVNIKEGYQIGASVHYTDLGNYQVETMLNNGPFNQTLNLETSSLKSRLEYNTTAIIRPFDSHQYFFDDFVIPTYLNDKYITNDNVFSITDGQLVSSSPTGNASILVADINNVRNFRLITVIQSTQFTNGGRMGLLFYKDTIEGGGGTGWEAKIVGSPTNEIRLRRYNGDGTTATIASASFTPANNTDYYLMVTSYQGLFRVYIGTDGMSYTKYIEQAWGNFTTGSVGVVTEKPLGTASSLNRIKLFDFVEIGKLCTRSDILKAVAKAAKIDSIKIENEIDTMGTFTSSVGSTWILGVTNSYEQVDLYHTSGGSLWHTFGTAGTSFNDFVVDYEIKGASGNKFGSFVGSTSTFYVNYYQFGTTGNDIVNVIGGVPYTYEKREEWFRAQPNKWYKGRIVKNGLNLFWYIEDNLVNAIWGVSLSTVEGGSNMFGFAGHKNGGSSSISSIRNVTVSRLDDLVEDIQISPNYSVGSVFDRFIPNGYASNWRQGSLDVFTIGSSRGSIGVTDFTYNSNENINNIFAGDAVYITNDSVDTRVLNSNTRVSTQFDSNRIDLVTDSNISTTNEAKLFANNFFREVNKEVQSIGIQHNARLTTELYDSVNLVDNSLGLSRSFIIYNVDKTYTPDSGFKQTLTIA